MLTDKTVHYQGRGTDLNALGRYVISYLQGDGFKVQSTKPAPNGMLIQAQKAGFLRDLITAERALNILIQGEPNDFTVRVGIGKWLQNIVVVTIETLLVSELFLPLDVAEMTWNLEVESKLLKKIDEFVSGPHTIAVPGTPPFAEGTVARITGAHKLIVEPHPEDMQVKVGDEVKIVAESAATLGTIQERATSPYSSNWGLIVRANRLLERCNANIGGTQLQGLDSTGMTRSEFNLPANSSITFRIPESLNVNSDSMVEVKDGDTSLVRERFGSIGPVPAMASAR